MISKLSQENIEQERIRRIIYLNLDRLFKDLNELNRKIDTTGRIQEKKKEKKEIFPEQD